MRGGRNLSKKTGGKAEKDGGEGEGHSIVNTNLTGEVIGSDATGRGSDISSSEASDADEDEQQLAEKKKLNGDGDGHAVDEGSKERGVDDQAKKQKDMNVA